MKPNPSIKEQGIEGYPNYTISDSGVVMSRTTGKPLIGTVASGYRKVMLRNTGSYKFFLVHRLVGLAFIPNPENKPCVNHIDGDKKNNAASNLEWCTYSENTRHAVRLGLQKGMPGMRHPEAKLDDSQIPEIRQRVAEGETQTSVAKDYGVTQATISLISRRKLWPHIA